MFLEQFVYEHKKYGDISVELSEHFNEKTKQTEIHVWAILFIEAEEQHVNFKYNKEENLSKDEIEDRLNKLIKQYWG